jgi:hypothetical protein
MQRLAVLSSMRPEILHGATNEAAGPLQYQHNGPQPRWPDQSSEAFAESPLQDGSQVMYFIMLHVWGLCMAMNFELSILANYHDTCKHAELLHLQDHGHVWSMDGAAVHSPWSRESHEGGLGTREGHAQGLPSGIHGSFRPYANEDSLKAWPLTECRITSAMYFTFLSSEHDVPGMRLRRITQSLHFQTVKP